MEEKIVELYRAVVKISADYMIYQKRNNVEEVKKLLPQIQEFVVWFMEENRLGIEEEFYQGMLNNLLQILNDILEAIQQGDRVLLHDAIAYGLIEYLELFPGTLPKQGQEEKEKDVNI